MMEKVSDYVFRMIAEKTSCRMVFMLPGGGCMHLVDSLGKTPGLSYCCTLHEQAAAIGADSLGQYSNDLGVALVTAGPGSTNALTAVAASWIDSTPVLILSGQAKTTDMMRGRPLRQMGIQEVDIARIASPVTKYAVSVTDPQRVRYEVEKALYLARHGRKGPVWLDFPLDVQGAVIDPEAQEGFTPASDAVDALTDADYQRVALEVLARLRQAKRPCVYVGNGVRLSGAVAGFRRLAERLRLPVMTTWKAADFLPEDHPLYAGRPGIIAQRAANLVQQGCDALWILGNRLDLCQTAFNHGGFAPGAAKIVTDIDAAEIGKLEMNLAYTARVDAGRLIAAMLREEPEPLDTANWIERIAATRRRYPVILPEYCTADDGKVNLYYLVKALGDNLKSGDIFVPGSSGMCAEVTLQAVELREGVRLFNTPGLGSMGFGLPAALATAIFSGKRVMSVIGDGGLQHNIQELQTWSRTRADLKLFVLNNDGYGSIKNMQEGRFAGHYVASTPASGVTLPCLEKVAGAYGIPYRAIRSQKEVEPTVREAWRTPGPVIIEVFLDPAVKTQPRCASRMLPDGGMETLPMENVSPFLPEDELQQAIAYLKG